MLIGGASPDEQWQEKTAAEKGGEEGGDCGATVRAGVIWALGLCGMGAVLCNGAKETGAVWTPVTAESEDEVKEEGGSIFQGFVSDSGAEIPSGPVLCYLKRASPFNYWEHSQTK